MNIGQRTQAGNYCLIHHFSGNVFFLHLIKNVVNNNHLGYASSYRIHN